MALVETARECIDEIPVSPGATGRIRIAENGRVYLAISDERGGHEVDVTEGAAALGAGLRVVGARASQIRIWVADRKTVARDRSETRRRLANAQAKARG